MCAMETDRETSGGGIEIVSTLMQSGSTQSGSHEDDRGCFLPRLAPLSSIFSADKLFVSEAHARRDEAPAKIISRAPFISHFSVIVLLAPRFSPLADGGLSGCRNCANICSVIAAIPASTLSVCVSARARACAY